MPSLSTMSDEKNTSEIPVVITQVAAPTPTPKNTKKYVIFGVSIVAGVAIVLTAILVGMYMFTEAEKEIIKQTLSADKDNKQDATTDQNDNSIEYHVQNTNYEMWVIDDYNKDIEVLKVKTKDGTNCYAVPLNRSAVAKPSDIKTPENVPQVHNETDKLTYVVTNTPVIDSSFLSKKARTACQGISVYWMYPKCNSDDSTGVQKNKRWAYYYCYNYYYYCYGYWYGYYNLYLCYTYRCLWYYY